ncbi:MAG TPA: hypothetical protein VLS45_06910, partial [Methylomicrobium sp.]|nr:hypothetical protein [Methylomicrobium sp.]
MDTMTRDQLLDAWAEITLGEAAAKVPPHGDYDVELEKRRLDFEIKKFEAEEARRKEEAELRDRLRQEEREREDARVLREDRLRKEELDLRKEELDRQEQLRKEQREREEARELREERFRKEEIDRQEKVRKDELDRQEARALKEAEERIAMCRLQETELQIRRDQWDWQKTRDLREAERKQTPAAQVKFFGEVLKNVMPKFPFDAAEIPTFFSGAEKLFSSFEVPKELRSKLLLPYLSDKAKSLMLRLTQSQQESYDEVKRFILAEMKLTPLQFKQRFERATKNKEETYTLYCSRLKNLLTYYCNGRDVKCDFDTLFSLLVADRIKSTLPEACLNHILAAEGENWMKCDDLANAVDIYFANHSYDGRPKFERNEPRTKTGNAGNRDYQG